MPPSHFPGTNSPHINQHRFLALLFSRDKVAGYSVRLLTPPAFFNSMNALYSDLPHKHVPFHKSARPLIYEDHISVWSRKPTNAASHIHLLRARCSFRKPTESFRFAVNLRMRFVTRMKHRDLHAPTSAGISSRSELIRYQLFVFRV